MKMRNVRSLLLSFGMLCVIVLFLAGCPIGVSPILTTQPGSLTAVLGDTVTFTISANGTAPFTFQWRKDGVDINGATTSSYQLASVQADDAGSYTCLVSNAYGSIVSNAAVLTIGEDNLPDITEQPESQVVGTGDPVSFAVLASGNGQLSYQWRKDTVPIPGATNEVYSIDEAATADQGDYTCVVSNISGSRISDPATLVVSADYANGFDDGFAEDDWYWKGFDDSYDTLTKTPVYYQGGEIPFVETPYYDRGYYDGVWYAYNDGYFVSYDDSFTIGFSEGYDAAFFSGYLTFLQED